MKAAAKQENKNDNLIYIASENTMTITPGIYNVPKNIMPGVYYVSALNDAGLNIRDAAGRYKNFHEGRLRLDEGSQLEVTGEYQFRFNEKKND